MWSQLAVISTLISIVLGMEALRRLHRLLDEGRQRQGDSLIIGLPAEGKDLFDEVSCPHCRLKDIVEISLLPPTVRNIINDHLGKTKDGCKDIVEIMGNTSGKGADGFHLLDSEQMFLRLLALICLFLEGFVSLA